MRAKARRNLHIHLELSRRQCLAVLVAVLVCAGALKLSAVNGNPIIFFPAPNGNYVNMNTTQDTYLASVSGKVGIGTIAPAQTLDVNGTAQLRGSAGGSGLSVDGSGNVSIGGTGSFTLGSAAADWGPPYPAAGTMYFNTTYNTIRMYDGSGDAYGWVPVTSGRRQFVTACYRGFLGRAPDLAGLASWLQSGMGYLDISVGFAGSGEYNTDYPTPKQFVDQLYVAYLGRTFDAAGEASWITMINNAPPDAQSQSAIKMAVARGFATSQECRTTAATGVCTSMRY